MHLPRRRSLVAAAVIAGFGIYWATPQWVAAEPAPAPVVDVDPVVDAVDPVDPVPALPQPDSFRPSSDTTTAQIGVPEPEVEVEVEVEEEIAPAPVVAPVAAPTDPVPAGAAPRSSPVVEAVTAPPMAAAAHLEETVVDDVPATGTVTVTVPVAQGADRTVTLLGLDGRRAAGPLAVTGEPMVLTLPAGTYDLLVEQVAHEGGAFATRVRFTLDAGGTVAATYDPDTLDATVVA